MLTIGAAELFGLPATECHLVQVDTVGEEQTRCIQQCQISNQDETSQTCNIVYIRNEVFPKMGAEESSKLSQMESLLEELKIAKSEFQIFKHSKEIEDELLEASLNEYEYVTQIIYDSQITENI